MTTLAEIKARAESVKQQSPDYQVGYYEAVTSWLIARVEALEAFKEFVWKDHLYCGEAGPLKCDRAVRVKCTGLHLCSHLAELEGSEE